jgi:asparagine synthase (glutamine-hydrolysing)
VDQIYCHLGEISAATRAALFTPETLERLGEGLPVGHYARALMGGDSALPVDRVMQLHLHTELADDFLPKVDFGTMGASLEARCPFLDVDVIELALGIPASIRFLKGQRKGLLRALARRSLPPEVVDRGKQGFAAPVGHWLRRPDWCDLVDDLILGPQLERRGWFRRQTLQRLVVEHRSGREHGQLLWTLVVLELWIRLNVESAPSTLGEMPPSSKAVASAMRRLGEAAVS